MDIRGWSANSIASIHTGKVFYSSVDCAWIVGQYIDTLEKYSKNTLYLWISVDCPWIVGQYTPQKSIPSIHMWTSGHPWIVGQYIP